jgi:hypothetical protein
MMSTLAFFFSMLGASADVIPATLSALADVEVLDAEGVVNTLTFCGAVPCGKNLWKFSDGECFVWF